MSYHNKRTLANEYLLCRKIPHRWIGNIDQLIIGDKTIGMDVIYCIHNIPYEEIIPVIDGMVVYDEFGSFIGLRR